MVPLPITLNDLQPIFQIHAIDVETVRDTDIVTMEY